MRLLFPLLGGLHIFSSCPADAGAGAGADAGADSAGEIDAHADTAARADTAGHTDADAAHADATLASVTAVILGVLYQARGHPIRQRSRQGDSGMTLVADLTGIKTFRRQIFLGVPLQCRQGESGAS